MLNVIVQCRSHPRSDSAFSANWILLRAASTSSTSMKLLALLALASVGALRAPLGATSRGAALRATVEKPVATTAADDVYVLETPTEVAKEYEGGPKPGLDENERFACDASVAAWAEFQRGGAAAPLDNLREAAWERIGNISCPEAAPPPDRAAIVPPNLTSRSRL